MGDLWFDIGKGPTILLESNVICYSYRRLSLAQHVSQTFVSLFYFGILFRTPLDVHRVIREIRPMWFGHQSYLTRRRRIWPKDLGHFTTPLIALKFLFFLLCCDTALEPAKSPDEVCRWPHPRNSGRTRSTAKEGTTAIKTTRATATWFTTEFPMTAKIAMAQGLRLHLRANTVVDLGPFQQALKTG